VNRLRLLTDTAPRGLTDTAHLFLRSALGVIFVAHGWDTHTMGVANVVEAQRAIGIPLPEVSGLITIYVELVGGVLLVIGALTRLLAVALTGIMLGAWVFVHAGNGVFVQDGGYELVMILAVAAAVLAVAGPGRLSADHLLVERLARSTRSGSGLVRSSM